jgi:hypothetical protein
LYFHLVQVLQKLKGLQTLNLSDTLAGVSGKPKQLNWQTLWIWCHVQVSGKPKQLSWQTL